MNIESIIGSNFNGIISVRKNIGVIIKINKKMDKTVHNQLKTLI